MEKWIILQKMCLYLLLAIIYVPPENIDTYFLT